MNLWKHATKWDAPPREDAVSPRASCYQPYRPQHERASHAQQRARRQSPCTHTNRSPECVPAPPHAAHSRAEPEEPRRSAGAPQTRAAPSKSRPERVRSARERGTQEPKP
jgi:hypothetical protein